MTVRAVDVYNHDKSAFPTVLTGTALGIGAGYAVKYILPVTEKENDFSKHAITMASRKIANKNMVHDIKISAANAQGLKDYDAKTKLNLSLAQDTFVKMIENKKGNEGFLADNVAKTVKELNKKVPGSGNEYKEIIRKVNENAKLKADRLIKACNFTVKGERGLKGFLIPGAIAGFLAGVFVNVFRDNKQV